MAVRTKGIAFVHPVVVFNKGRSQTSMFVRDRSGMVCGARLVGTHNKWRFEQSSSRFSRQDHRMAILHDSLTRGHGSLSATRYTDGMHERVRKVITSHWLVAQTTRSPQDPHRASIDRQTDPRPLDRLHASKGHPGPRASRTAEAAPVAGEE